MATWHTYARHPRTGPHAWLDVDTFARNRLPLDDAPLRRLFHSQRRRGALQAPNDRPHLVWGTAGASGATRP